MTDPSRPTTRHPEPWRPGEHGAFMLELAADGQPAKLHTFCRRPSADTNADWTVAEFSQVRGISAESPCGEIYESGNFRFFPCGEWTDSAEPAFSAFIEAADARLHRALPDSAWEFGPEFPIWKATRFLPERCPRCLQHFKETTSFGFWAGGDGGSYAEARLHGHEAFPREYEVGDLIVCSACRNVTFRFVIDERSFLSLEEATEAVSEHGFTSIEEEVGLANSPDAHILLVQAFERESRERRRSVLFGPSEGPLA